MSRFALPVALLLFGCPPAPLPQADAGQPALDAAVPFDAGPSCLALEALEPSYLALRQYLLTLEPPRGPSRLPRRRPSSGAGRSSARSAPAATATIAASG